jgi:alcohol dehydrogenase class IV
MYTKWNYPTEIFFGNQSCAQLESIIAEKKRTNLLVVIDSFLLTQPTITELLTRLKKNTVSLTVFSEFKGNPTSEHVKAATDTNNTSYDGIVAIGGGSALDVAKVIAVTANNQHSAFDFIDNQAPTPDLNLNEVLPIIAIPTTSGTGSEVSRASLIIDQKTQEKHILFHPLMLPQQVICDPQLTVTCPPQLTAWAGMDALAHNLEALCSPEYHPQADGIAYEGIRLIHKSLVTAFEDGNNLTARSDMMCASLMGASAFQKGLGAIHSLSHPVGGIYNSHHGLLNAIFMPYVLQYNRPYIEEKMSRLARYINLQEQSFDGIVQWVNQLLETLGIPDNLAAIGIDDNHRETIAERAFHDPSSSTNPRSLNINDCLQLFDAALQGSIELTPTL